LTRLASARIAKASRRSAPMVEITVRPKAAIIQISDLNTVPTLRFARDKVIVESALLILSERLSGVAKVQDGGVTLLRLYVRALPVLPSVPDPSNTGTATGVEPTIDWHPSH
jgi:hypothetical protein